MSIDQHLEFSKRLHVFQLSLEEGNGSGFHKLEFLVHGPSPASPQDPAQLLVLPAGLLCAPSEEGFLIWKRTLSPLLRGSLEGCSWASWNLILPNVLGNEFTCQRTIDKERKISIKFLV